MFSVMLHRSGEKGQPCFVPDLKGKAFIFFIKYNVRPVFFIFVPYQVNIVPFYCLIPEKTISSIIDLA